jgi:hypothetical protein
VTPPLAELVSLVRDTQAHLLQATAAAAMWQTRAEMLASQLEQAQLALAAPKESAPQERPFSGDSEGLSAEPTQPVIRESQWPAMVAPVVVEPPKPRPAPPKPPPAPGRPRPPRPKP